jgi:hypothetical protein
MSFFTDGFFERVKDSMSLNEFNGCNRFNGFEASAPEWRSREPLGMKPESDHDPMDGL